MPRTGNTTFYLPFCLGLSLIALASPVAAKAASQQPLTVESHLTGLTFDDPPTALPITDDFKNALAAAGKGIGATCSAEEAYGWRLKQTEQTRVNQIFFTVADRLRSLGYSVESKTFPSIAPDITLFTAKTPMKQFLLMWSAGDVGLVLALCATQPMDKGILPQAQTPMPAGESSPIPTPLPDLTFSPIGTWTGNYTCGQTYTGATLTVATLNADAFTGTFHFFPTPKNLTVSEGTYAVSGTYNAGTHELTVRPGPWIDHPGNATSATMDGRFDPVARTFSAYFEGVADCTSFEAKYTSAPLPPSSVQKAKPNVTPKKKKIIRHKKKVAAIKPPPDKATLSRLIPEAASEAKAVPQAKETAAPNKENSGGDDDLTLEVGAPEAAAPIAPPPSPVLNPQ